MVVSFSGRCASQHPGRQDNGEAIGVNEVAPGQGPEILGVPAGEIQGMGIDRIGRSAPRGCNQLFHPGQQGSQVQCSHRHPQDGDVLISEARSSLPGGSRFP